MGAVFFIGLMAASGRTDGQIFGDRVSAAVAEFARQRGWRYSKNDRRNLPARFAGEPFDSGQARWAKHVISGTHRGRPMMAFDLTVESRRTSSWS